MLQLIADRPSTISKAAVAGTVCIIATLGLVVAKRGQHHAVAAEKAQARQEDDDWSDAIALYQRLKKRKNRKASVSRIVNSANGLLNTQRIAELRKLFPMFFVAISIRAEDQTTIDGVELVNEQHFERVVTARVEYLFGSVDE